MTTPEKRKRGRPPKQSNSTNYLSLNNSPATKPVAAAASSSVPKQRRKASSRRSPSCSGPSEKSQQLDSLDRTLTIGATTSTSKYLHSDVLVQILIRLPVCSIVKCMCVCKQWYCFITSAEFVDTHLSHRLKSPPSNVIGYQPWFPKKEFFTFYRDNETSSILRTNPFPFNREKLRSDNSLRIIGSLHGLIYVGIYGQWFYSKSNSYLWNPFIKRWLEIPQSQLVLKKIPPTYVVMGFGFDFTRKDYKIVKIIFVDRRRRRVTNAEPDEICQGVGVYSLRERSWKDLDANDVRPWVMRSDSLSSCLTDGCFTNGAIHWIAYNQTKNQDWTTILSFDVSNECFNKIELPEDLIKGYRLYISETNGLLSVFHNTYERGFPLQSCNIWVQKEYNMKNSWTKLCNIDCMEGTYLTVLKVRENGEVMLVKSILEYPDRKDLVSYDPMTKEFKAVKEQVSSLLFYAGSISESLLLLDLKDAKSYDEP